MGALALLAAGVARVEHWRAERAITAINAPLAETHPGSHVFTGGLRARLALVTQDRDALVARASACDHALDTGDGFGVQASCSLAVKTVLAQRDARTAEVANRDETIRLLRTDQAASAAQAEARGRDEGRRNTDARQAIQSAPVGGDGLRACDAGVPAPARVSAASPPRPERPPTQS